MKLVIIVALFFLSGIGTRAQITATNDKTYKAVKIGSQVWMAENLDVTTYRNGDTIPEVQDPKAWSNLKSGAWCYYGGDKKNGEKYGRLYNWYAVNDPRGLAPRGWHVPSDAEWKKLSTFLGGYIGTSPKLKSPKGWNNAGNGTNETGFTALPGGTCSVDLFSFEGSYGYWWTSTEFDSYSAWDRFLGYNNNNIGRGVGWKQFGNSVRCIKGEDVRDINQGRRDSLKNETTKVNQIYNFKTVTIGSQVWMSQNLDVDKFQNGDTIPRARTDFEWARAGKLKQPAWCYYNNDSVNGKKYGRIYNWYAINDKRGLAPAGWHVPSQADWTSLANQLGGERVAGAKIRFTGEKKNENTNESGFTGLLSGFRAIDGRFLNYGIAGYWWSSTESSPVTGWCYTISYFGSSLNADRLGYKQMGFYVRFVKE
jgi:uncharacterized protein (TIGR02145 family)